MKARHVGTHDGTFHADEVTACALLLYFDLVDEDKIIRTRDDAILDECEFVCDVGGIFDPSKKRFDHHQSTYTGLLSSAGMVLEFLRDTGVMEKREYDLFNYGLVRGVDAHDNGRDPQLPGFCSFSHVISGFTPTEYNAPADELYNAFMEAVRFAKGHLSRLHKRFLYSQSCRKAVEECMAKYKECMVFERGLPWLESFFELEGADHPALFVVMPSGNHWKLRGVPPTFEERMQVRMPLPEKWAGLLGDDLKKVSGIDGAIFCHKGRFISVWETKEDALKALELVLKSHS